MQINGIIRMATKDLLSCLFLIGTAGSLAAQGNTAITSGSVGKCAVWDYPYTLYNTAAATQTVNSGVNVTVDQNRNFGAIVLNGSGGMDMSGGNGITFSGSGGEIGCRWDIASKPGGTMVNNDGNASGKPGRSLGVFFTAPYSSSYIYQRISGGWSGLLSGAYLNGGISINVDATGDLGSVFFRNQPGTCGYAPGAGADYPATFFGGAGPIALGAGQTLSYVIGTGYSNSPSCNNTTMNYSIGTAQILLSN